MNFKRDPIGPFEDLKVLERPNRLALVIHLIPDTW